MTHSGCILRPSAMHFCDTFNRERMRCVNVRNCGVGGGRGVGSSHKAHLIRNETPRERLDNYAEQTEIAAASTTCVFPPHDGPTSSVISPVNKPGGTEQV